MRATPTSARELPITGIPEQVADRLGPYIEAGAERVALVFYVVHWSEAWDLVADATAYSVLEGGT